MSEIKEYDKIKNKANRICKSLKKFIDHSADKQKKEIKSMEDKALKK
jgi:hypothetical protein